MNESGSNNSNTASGKTLRLSTESKARHSGSIKSYRNTKEFIIENLAKSKKLEVMVSENKQLSNLEALSEMSSIEIK